MFSVMGQIGKLFQVLQAKSLSSATGAWKPVTVETVPAV